jgi:hypothetical protein
MHQRLRGLSLLSRFAADDRIVELLATEAELADAGVVGAADVAWLGGMISCFLVRLGSDLGWWLIGLLVYWIVVTSDLVICLRRVGCHDIVLERFSVEVGIGQFSTAGRARRIFF